MNKTLLSKSTLFFLFINICVSIAALSQQKIVKPESLKNKSIEEIAQLITDKKIGELYEKQFFEGKDKNEHLDNLIDLGIALYNLKNYKQSITYFIKAEKLAKEIKNDKLLFFSVMKQSHCFLQIWKNEKAIQAYYKALTIAKASKNINQEIIAYSGLIAVLPLIGKADKAIDFSNYALQLVKKSSFNNKKNHVRLLTTIADAYLTKGDYQNVQTYIDKGIFMAKKLTFKEGLLDLYIKKGRVFRHKKELNLALEYLHKATSIMEKDSIAHKFFPLVNANYYLARCHFDLQEYNESINYLQKVTSFVTDEDLEKMNVIDVYYLLAKSYVKIDKKDKAIELLDKVIELKGRVESKKNKTINEFYEQDSVKLLNQIEGLQGQLKKDKTTKTYLLIWIAMVLLALISLVLIYVRKQQANQKKFKTLLQQINDLELNKNKTDYSNNQLKKNKKNLMINDDKVIDIVKKLNKLEAQEYFLNVNCNLRAVAKKVKTNATYLSQIINNHKGKKFNDYINDLRIEYAVKKLKSDKRFRSFSIKGIATELGYKSDYSFAKHFKNKTGINPSYYIKEINKLAEEEK